MTFWEELWWQIGISWAGVLGVLISCVVLYLLFTVILRVAGPRLSGSPSVLSVAVMALLAALIARSILGNSPTLLGGLVAIGTLMVLEHTLGGRHITAARRVLRGPRPTVVMVHGHVLAWQLRHLGMHEELLLTQLRREGVHHVVDADLVILEARGGLTIVRRGERIDRRLVGDVRGAGMIPDSVLL
ncbi:DUF421 domain-containing protein [Brachybacterium sp. YJGR34]|uniref:DUF421 domain-containing protein n=1 Tax=Brachybacterium sp. YJGR34 TaxID=2059911 RepID=UPI000E0AF477|nr:YetF domain-containing protein [Brachybacterium sp. YJGR34]